MKKALITGIAGFAGSHLTEHLLTKSFSVSGIVLGTHPVKNLNSIQAKIQIFKCNLLNEKELKKLVKNVSPDFVFHLAAFSSPAKSFKNPKESIENNLMGELNLLNSLAEIKSKAKILVIGSADEYGNVNQKDLPVNEEAPLAPTSPYAISKVAQDLLGLQFFLHHKLQVVRVRPFNHIGPRQSPDFVVSAFASQIAQIEKKGQGTLKVGDLNTSRDFTDVRDMVKAYLLALEKGKVGEVYNIGSGKAVKIGDILERLINLSGAKIKVKKDMSRLRAQDIKIIYADISKFTRQTGWKVKIALTKTLSDTIEYARAET